MSTTACLATYGIAVWATTVLSLGQTRKMPRGTCAISGWYVRQALLYINGNFCVVYRLLTDNPLELMSAYFCVELLEKKKIINKNKIKKKQENEEQTKQVISSCNAKRILVGFTYQNVGILNAKGFPCYWEPSDFLSHRLLWQHDEIGRKIN